MSIQGYKVFRWHHNRIELCDTLVGTQRRDYLNKLRMKGYIVKKIIRPNKKTNGKESEKSSS